jgi:hypothetical protein
VRAACLYPAAQVLNNPEFVIPNDIVSALLTQVCARAPLVPRGAAHGGAPPPAPRGPRPPAR